MIDRLHCQYLLSAFLHQLLRKAVEEYQKILNVVQT